MLPKPQVERLDPTVEVSPVVSRVECLRPAKARHLFRARTTHEINNRTLDLGWPIECRNERLPRVPVENELSSVSENGLGSFTAALHEELRDGLTDLGGRLTKENVVRR